MEQAGLNGTRHHYQVSSGDDATRDYDVTRQVGHLLRKAHQRHVAIFHEALAEQQLTPTQFVALCILRDQGDSSQVDLVRATAVDQATIRGVVERLKARDPITLKRDGQDARKVVIALTQAGLRLLEEAIPVAADVTKATVEALNPAERVALDYLLRKIST